MSDENGERVGGASKTAELTAAYEADEAEAESLKYLIENSCISCDRILPRYSVRILPPSYVQERDESVRKGLVQRRLMCIECYNSMKVAHRHRIRRNPMLQSSPFAKEEVARYLLD